MTGIGSIRANEKAPKNRVAFIATRSANSAMAMLNQILELRAVGRFVLSGTSPMTFAGGVTTPPAFF